MNENNIISSNFLTDIAGARLDRNNLAHLRTFIPTGFPALDKKLGGGISPGISVLGAASSLGKSTLALQMAAHFAQNNVPVVYFSYEMSRDDLLSKLISMQTYLDNPVRTGLAQSSSNLSSAAFYAHMSNEEWKAIYNATLKVYAYANHLSIIDTSKDVLTAGGIYDAVKTYIEETSKTNPDALTPVVIVDYLQILPLEKGRGFSDKQAVDFAMSKFRSLATTYRLPVFVISALNRASYDTDAHMAAFRDSSSIEYSADLLMQLQLSGIGTEDFDATDAKADPIRKMELVILKQRFGATGEPIPFNFYPVHNYFMEEPREQF